MQMRNEPKRHASTTGLKKTMNRTQSLVVTRATIAPVSKDKTSSPANSKAQGTSAHVSTAPR
jgi:hypothetical protein